MVTRKLQFLLLICTVISVSSISAQKIVKKADKQFELRDYHKALRSYQEALAKHPDNRILNLKIGECLRRTNQVLDAQEWYEIAIHDKDTPAEYNLYYGHLLKSIGEYDKAPLFYEKYKTIDADIAEHYMLSCDFALNMMKEKSDYELMLESCNSKSSDIGPKFYGSDLVFTSFRDNDTEADILGCKLYTKSPGVESRPLRSAIKKQHGIGFISYAITQELCAYTVSNCKDGHKPVAERDEDHAIYLAQVTDGGDFIDPVPFKYNEVTSSTAFPHLAFDGKALYFASNRAGGYGGYDLYVSYLKDDDWTAPENLGPSINTIGNEISPFFTGKELYFASDFHAGLGGYDLFISDVVMGEWKYPINLGNGINSPGDDYFPSIQNGTDYIYFSSNRLGGRGGDDIYFGKPLERDEFFGIDQIYQSTPPVAIALNETYVPTALDGPVAKVSKSTTRTNAELVTSEATTITYIGSATEDTERNTPTTNTADDEILNMAGETQARIAQADLVSQEQVRSCDIVSQLIVIPLNPLVTENFTFTPKIINYTDLKEPEKESEMVVSLERPLATKLITEVPGSRSITKDISLSGAHRVSYGDLLPTENKVYFIQLASLSKSRGNVADYKSLIRYGNIYKIYKTYSTKIKLGYFIDKQEAQRVLKNVKAQGFRDAFITQDPLKTGEMELFIAGKEYDYNGANYTTPRREGSKYKIRLASYEDPIWFDIKSAKELGEIEQWTKGDWTIFILSGFRDLEEAHAAKIRAINRGFADAEVVIDNGGILERIKTN